jgi:hypothetical protein
MKPLLRPPLTLPLLLSCALSGGCAVQAQPEAEVRRGVFQGASEVSGVAMLPGGRLILVSDEKHVFQITNAAKTLEKMLQSPIDATFNFGQEQGLEELPLPADSDDLEDAAWDGKGTLYVVASHSVSKKGKSKPERCVIVRWPIDATGKPASQGQTIEGLLDSLPKDLQSAVGRTAAKSGFNIEGATIAGDGSLLLGLRSPTETVSSDRKSPSTNEDAILLRIASPAALPYKPEKITLDLHGEGVRGLCYDEKQKGCWIVSGASPDLPDDFPTSPWSLWFWADGETGVQKKKISLPTGMEGPRNIESVCRVELGEAKKPYLLLTEDAKGSSPFWLVPLPVN